MLGGFSRGLTAGPLALGALGLTDRGALARPELVEAGALDDGLFPDVMATFGSDDGWAECAEVLHAVSAAAPITPTTQNRTCTQASWQTSEIDSSPNYGSVDMRA